MMYRFIFLISFLCSTVAMAESIGIVTVADGPGLLERESGTSLETEKTPVGDPIRVILLLMDPKTRTFEILQLEFDSSVAKVSDIYGHCALGILAEYCQF